MTTQNNNTPAPPSPAAVKTMELQKFFEKDTVRNQMQVALSDNQDSFIASVIDLYTSDSELMKCAPEQVAMQALKAAVLKLPVIKSMGYAYVIAYKGVPQLQIGYKGLVQLAIRTNQYRVIHTDVVYEGQYKNANKLTGEFDLTGQQKSDVVIGYFAHFEMKNGFSKTLYMTKAQVTAHAEKYSKTFNSNYSPWKSEYDSMAKKTVLKGLLSHWGYMSVEMQDAMNDADEDVANKVMNEIKEKGNVTDLEIIPPGPEPDGSSNQQQPRW